MATKGVKKGTLGQPVRDARDHSPQELASSESQALRFPRLRFQEEEPTSHERKGREIPGA